MTSLQNSYTYTGEPATLASSYEGTSYVTGYTYAGSVLPLNPAPESPFAGKRWAFCGDSNFDPTGTYQYYVGISDDGSRITAGKHADVILTDLVNAELPASSLPLVHYARNQAGDLYAAGGRGILRNFENEIASAQTDLDAIVVLVSPNDWQSVSDNIPGVPFVHEGQYGRGIVDSTNKQPYRMVVDHGTAPADDSYRAGHLTVAGRINDLLTTFYERFYVNGPRKCRIGFLNGMAYPIGSEKEDPYSLKGYMSNKGYINVCKVLAMCIADWLATDKLGCRTLGWLASDYLEMYHHITCARTGDRTYKVTDHGLVHYDDFLETDPESPYYGRPFEPWHMTGAYDVLTDSQGNPFVYAPYYVPYNNTKTTTNSSGQVKTNVNVVPWGHYGYRLHFNFVAPLLKDYLKNLLT